MTNNSALCTDPVKFSKKKVCPPTFDIRRKMNLYYTLLMCETNTFLALPMVLGYYQPFLNSEKMRGFSKIHSIQKVLPDMKPTFRNYGCSRQKSPPPSHCDPKTDQSS